MFCEGGRAMDDYTRVFDIVDKHAETREILSAVYDA